MRVGLHVQVSNERDASTLRRSFPQRIVRIGRNALNDLQIDDEHVSQFHAVLEMRDERVLLRDLGSRNGTRLGAGMAPPHELVDLTEHPGGFAIAHYTLRAAVGPMRVSSSPPPNVEATVKGSSLDAGRTIALDASIPPQTGPDDAAARERELADFALACIRDVAENLLPGQRLETPADVARVVTRMRDVLEMFFRSFVPLRDGYRQFTAEMGIEPPGATASGVEAARDVRELAAWLLDARNDVAVGRRAVEGTFADLMIHQLALLNAVMRGVKSLLHELAPPSIEAALEGKTGFRVGPWRFRELWRLYTSRYDDVNDSEKRTFAALFGREFAKAYSQYRASGDAAE